MSTTTDPKPKTHKYESAATAVLPLEAPALGAEKRWTCGTLTYTKAALFVLFAWLLWGDFAFSVIEFILPRTLNLKLKSLGATNATIAAMYGTIPKIMDIAVGPWVSYKSDRHRGPRGRRIPYILYTLPFLVASLILVGWSEHIGGWLQATFPRFGRIPETTLTIALIAIFVTSFHFFNNFVGTVYYYLFNDVVPAELLGRINGWLQIVGSVGGMLFSWFLFEHAVEWFRPILTGVGILYLVGMGVMCLTVKEGKYPPPPQGEKFTGFFGKFRAIGRESFSTRFYWYFYLTNALMAMASATGPFRVFLDQQLNLNLKQQGRLGTIAQLGAMVATYFAASFVDRWHPLRIFTYKRVAAAVFAFNGWIWLFITLPSSVQFWAHLIGGLADRFSEALGALCGIALFMRLMPKSLYGQFSAANSIIRAAGGLVAGLLAGGFLDLMKWILHGSDMCYRFGFLWSAGFTIGSAVFTVLAYREWQRLGGDEHYQAPAPWTPTGREPSQGVFKSVRSIPRYLVWGIGLNVVSLVLNFILMGVLTWEMLRRGPTCRLGDWHIAVWFPIKIGLSMLSLSQLWDIVKDARARERGEKTRYGLPHHGIWMVSAVTGLAGFPAFWLKTQMLITRGLAHEIYILSIANLIGVALGMLNVYLIRWFERDVPEHELHPDVRKARQEEAEARGAAGAAIPA